MAELDLGGEPIFIDVGKGSEQYCTLPYEFTQDILLDQHVVVKNAKEHIDIVAQSLYNAENDVKNTETTAQQGDGSKTTSTGCLLIQSRRVRCPECHRYTAENEEKMLRHIRRVHRGENPFQCYMCDYSTYNKSLFEEHTRIHQGIKPFKCSHCPHRSVSKKNMKKHELIHRPDNPLRCSACEFIARHTRAFKFHASNCSGSKASSAAPARKPPRKLKVKPRLKCDKCCYVTKSEVDMGRHKKLKCSWKAKFVFNCALCDWCSSNKPKILLHLIHHPAQRVDESIDVNILRKFGIM